MNYEKTIKKIRENLKNYLIKNNLKSLVIGVSGGADSALICALSYPVCKELGVEMIGRFITIESNKPEEKERAENIGKHFCTNFRAINLTEEYIESMFWITSFEGDDVVISYESETEKDKKIRMGNVKARMRMIYLYDLAQKNKGLVLSTDNYTELMVGFWTLHGDVGDFGLIQELWKTEVYEMIEWLSDNELSGKASDSLRCMLDAVATDGLGITSSDLDQLLPDWKERYTTTREGYKEVDNILEDWLYGFDENHPARLEESHPVISRHLRTQFKRDNPLNLKRYQIVVQK